MDNGRLRSDTLDVLAGVEHRRVSYRIEGAFNFAHKLNFAARHATGDHLVVFNDDIEVITDEWLTAMLEFSQQRDVGAVGAKLLYPDGRLQHAGIVLGVCGVAAHAWHGLAGDTPGYASSAIAVRNYSAVTGACLMTRRSVFEEVGGFNERLRDRLQRRRLLPARGRERLPDRVHAVRPAVSSRVGQLRSADSSGSRR